MGRRILILIFILCSLQSAQAFADDSDVGVTQSSEAFLPKPFVNSVLFGTGAGLLLGLVLGGGMPGIFRGASLGLYGGIVLGWYVSSDHGRSSNAENNDPISNVAINDPPKKNIPQFHFTFNF